MVVDILKNEAHNPITNIFGMLFFGLAVSVDSFGVGMGLKLITSHLLSSCLIFSLISFIMTYIGLTFGKKIGIRVGNIANIIGGIILIILGIIYMFK